MGDKYEIKGSKVKEIDKIFISTISTKSQSSYNSEPATSIPPAAEWDSFHFEYFRTEKETSVLMVKIKHKLAQLRATRKNMHACVIRDTHIHMHTRPHKHTRIHVHRQVNKTMKLGTYLLPEASTPQNLHNLWFSVCLCLTVELLVVVVVQVV